jgi:hypothetical protein
MQSLVREGMNLFWVGPKKVVLRIGKSQKEDIETYTDLEFSQGQS